MQGHAEREVLGEAGAYRGLTVELGVRHRPRTVTCCFLHLPNSCLR